MNAVELTLNNTITQHNHKSIVKLYLHPVKTSIEQVKWLRMCGLMTWTEVAINRIREDDRNRPLDALMLVRNEHGSLGSMLASLRWNYDLMKALYDNPQAGAYEWSLSFDDDETFLTLHNLARSNLAILPVDDAWICKPMMARNGRVVKYNMVATF